MKKTICIIAVLLGVVVVGAFSVSTLKSKFGTVISRSSITRHRVAEVTQETPTPKAQTSEVVPSTPKAVFYPSVGGSTASTQNETSRDRISNRYTIEISAVSSQVEADNLLLKLKSEGISGFYTPSRRGPLVIYRVRVGLFTNADDAKKNLQKISLRSKVRGTVTRLH